MKEETLDKVAEAVDRNFEQHGTRNARECAAAACQEIAEWTESNTIEKVCEFIRKHGQDYVFTEDGTVNSWLCDHGMITELKKYMKG